MSTFSKRRGEGAAVMLPAIAARAAAIREIDESFMTVTFVWDSETSFKCDYSKL